MEGPLRRFARAKESVKKNFQALHSTALGAGEFLGEGNHVEMVLTAAGRDLGAERERCAALVNWLVDHFAWRVCQKIAYDFESGF